MAPLDAIVVPTARPATQLRGAAMVARQLGCPLVALCSGPARAADLDRVLGKVRGLELVAIDLPKGYHHDAVRFSTSGIAEATVGRRTDTSLKRNLGLLLARLHGWERMVFLDDDIEVPDPADLSRAAALLGAFDTVSLAIDGYPDNSVVCHAYRITGGTQDTFVGGGALAVAPQRTQAFFPDTYNEDWFFLLDKAKLRPVAVTGKVYQQPYDPFADPWRAWSEEFGDVLAEGVFWLLDHGRRVKDADVAHWTRFLRERALFIDDVTAKVRELEPDPARTRMLAALSASRRRHSQLTAELCEAYLRAWSADRTRWQRVLDGLPTGRSTGAALHHLGLVPQRHRHRSALTVVRPGAAAVPL
jgi:hypothetical protein